MLKRLSAPIATLSLAAVVVASAGTGAVAQRLIGSKDVADNSLTGKDLKNSTVTGQDVKDGSLTAADIAGGLPAGTGAGGPQGPKGDTGATGPQGPKGDPGPASSGGPVEILRWDVTFTSTGAGAGEWSTLIDTSSESFPKGTEFKTLDIQVSGDFSACTDSSINFQQGFQYLGAAGKDSGGPEYIDVSRFVSVKPGPLTVTAGCSNYTGPPDYITTRLAVPSFTASILFQVSHPSTIVTRAFD